MVVLLALGSAVAYGLSDFVGGVLARRASVFAIAVVGQSASTAATSVVALLLPGAPATSDWIWGAVAGVGSGVGAAFLYRGLASGRMSVVAPLSAVAAALLPVVVGYISGERPTLVTWLGVLCAFPAIWLVSRAADPASGGERSHRAGVADGLLAGLGFGALFAALGQVEDGSGLGPLALAQATSVGAIIALATALRQPWLPRHRGEAAASIAGLLGALATSLFLLSTQSGLLTVAAVLSSLYPASTVLLAALLLHERIRRSQGLGLLLAGAAVALVAGG
ncbi:MAG: DMT family transporter [Actinomycetota bacterium]|nr:DMT family transporter [Actinomycetota bacterium]